MTNPTISAEERAAMRANALRFRDSTYLFLAELAHDLLRLLDALEAAERDTARLDWLEKVVLPNGTELTWLSADADGSRVGHQRVSGTTVREAIDAARSLKETEGEAFARLEARYGVATADLGPMSRAGWLAYWRALEATDRAFLSASSKES